MGFGEPKASYFLAYLLMVAVGISGYFLFESSWLRGIAALVGIYGIFAFIITNSWALLIPPGRTRERYGKK
jgi:hypothetical protein